MRAILPVWILIAGATLLHGQAMIEYGIGAGRSGAAGAAAGKSVVHILGQVSTTLAGAARTGDNIRPAESRVVTVAAPAAAVAPQPAAPAAPIDFSEIAAGMDKAELMAKAGKPSMSVTSTESSTLVETCWYRAGANSVTVILRNGKVASITGAEKLAAK